MGHTNSTANLGLPQFIGTDKPTWLGDINSAFSAIDSYAGTNDAAVAGAVSDASSAISQASAAVNTANTANTTAGNASTAANNAIGVANTANAIAGTVDAKVGLLADLNTTDRTSIVNAINEVYGMAAGVSISVNSDGVKSYADLLLDLYALIDASKFNAKSVFALDEPGGITYFHSSSSASGVYKFTNLWSDTSAIDSTSITIRSSNCKYMTKHEGTTGTDNSGTVPPSGYVLSIIY